MEITGSGIIFFECDQDKNIFDVILFESNRNGKSTYEDLGGKIDRKDINLFGSNGKKFGHFNAAKREAKEESNGYLNIDIELLYNLPNILIKNGKHNYFSSYFCIDSNGFDTNDFLHNKKIISSLRGKIDDCWFETINVKRFSLNNKDNQKIIINAETNNTENNQEYYLFDKDSNKNLIFIRTILVLKQILIKCINSKKKKLKKINFIKSKGILLLNKYYQNNFNNIKTLNFYYPV